MKPSRMKALEALRKLQKIEADRAHKIVVSCLAEESRLEKLIAASEDDIRENTALVAMSQEEGHHSLTLRSGYREWLPIAQEQLRQKREELKAACQQTEEARADMAQAKIALEATLQLQQEFQKKHVLAQAKKQQSEIDEWSQRLDQERLI